VAVSDRRPTIIVVNIPMKLPSLANARLHWAARAKIVKRQRNAVRMALLGADHGRPMWAPFVVTITRLGPRQLDSDNCQSAAKHVRDQVAEYLGVDDGDQCYTWHYEQVKARLPGVRIVIEGRS
jgi:hypothetical protein